MTVKYWIHAPGLERWSRLFISPQPEMGNVYVATVVYHHLVEGKDSLGEFREVLDVSHKNFVGQTEEEALKQARTWLENEFGEKVHIKRL
ncbi:hypothetical protein [Archangium violaceum]|jgi:predicted RNase H-like HicB family nuclease|uniref:Uncharacterized protein n=1 Tax=Archangium violaceum Cb vi76 TaxID=1406225 RepID=A0A084SS64_9BACT|nr:hypothetical protein [Archangium violaceum]KFA91299.1 hypothetical protein Q664_22925 [Archangium violaceum Cb vi76]